MSVAHLARAVAGAIRGGSRLVTFRHASPADFERSAVLFATLVAIDICLMFVFCVIAFGVRGQLNLYEIPRALMFVPMVLAAGMVAQRASPGTDLLLLPVAFAGASIVMTIITSVIYILAQYQWVPFVETYWNVFDDVILGWLVAIVVLAVWRLVPGTPRARVATAAAALALVVLPSVWLPQGMLWMPRYDESGADALSSFHSLAQENAFYAQQGALERELAGVEPERTGVPDIYLVAAGLYAGEDVFMKEIRMIADLFRSRFDTAGRTITLINNVQTLDAHPIATLTSLGRSLKHVGEVLNAEEDVLVLYVSSHGSEKHELSVDFRPLRLSTIDPVKLKAALDESGIRWKVVVISACYSGGFVDALKDEHTLVITASSADKTSFGCGAGSDATYLAQALFGAALKKTYSFEAAFEEARKTIEGWERDKGHTPSDPQIFVGAQIRPKLAEVERRLSALAARGR
jgi:hypothetical protein